MAAAERSGRTRARRAIRALSPRRPARRLVRYLLAERRTLRQGSVALLIGAAAALVAGARLGTSTHAGLFEVTRQRTSVLYQNVFVAVAQTLYSSLYLAVLAKLSAVAFGLPSIPLLDFVTIALLGGVIDSSIILGLTVVLSVVSFRRGYDLDAVSTPIITAAADMTTVPVIYLVTFVV